jgi:hypothetical protein
MGLICIMKASVILPGFIGGLFGILIGLGSLLWWLVSASSSHVPRSWIEGAFIPPEEGALIFIVLGMAGGCSALLYLRKRKNLGWIIISCGILGFPAGYASGSYLVMSWIAWIIPGTLLCAAGLIALIGPEKIASSLPLLNSSEKSSRLLGSLLYGILYIFVLFLVMIALFHIGLAPDTSPQGKATQDQRDFENAAAAQSMGLYNESLAYYDRILARNQSNFLAWYDKGMALSKLDRHDEAVVCYERALEIEPGLEEAGKAKDDALRAKAERGTSLIPD